MGDAAEQEFFYGYVDHGFGYVKALFVVADEIPPADYPAEGALHLPASWHDLEAFCRVGAPHDLDEEVAEGSLLHDLCAVVGRVGKEVLQPRSVLADSVEDGVRASTVRHVRRREVHEHQASVVSTATWRLHPTILLAP